MPGSSLLPRPAEEIPFSRFDLQEVFDQDMEARV